MLKIVPSTTLRDNLADVINEVSGVQDYLLITKKGRPVSALVNLDFFENLLALSSPNYLKSIRQAREEADRGELFSHSEVFGSL